MMARIIIPTLGLQPFLTLDEKTKFFPKLKVFVEERLNLVQKK